MTVGPRGSDVCGLHRDTFDNLDDVCPCGHDGHWHGEGLRAVRAALAKVERAEDALAKYRGES